MLAYTRFGSACSFLYPVSRYVELAGLTGQVSQEAGGRLSDFLGKAGLAGDPVWMRFESIVQGKLRSGDDTDRLQGVRFFQAIGSVQKPDSPWFEGLKRALSDGSRETDVLSREIPRLDRLLRTGEPTPGMPHVPGPWSRWRTRRYARITDWKDPDEARLFERARRQDLIAAGRLMELWWSGGRGWGNPYENSHQTWDLSNKENPALRWFVASELIHHSVRGKNGLDEVEYALSAAVGCDTGIRQLVLSAYWMSAMIYSRRLAAMRIPTLPELDVHHRVSSEDTDSVVSMVRVAWLDDYFSDFDRDRDKIAGLKGIVKRSSGLIQERHIQKMIDTASRGPTQAEIHSRHEKLRLISFGRNVSEPPINDDPVEWDPFVMTTRSALRTLAAVRPDVRTRLDARRPSWWTSRSIADEGEPS